MIRTARVSFLTTVLGLVVLAGVAAPQQTAAQAQARPVTGPGSPSQPPAATAPKPIPPLVPATPVTPPPGYVIGPDDVLQVLYWRDKDMSAEVVVRPDGLITLPVVNDVQAAGLTPDKLREKVTALAMKFYRDDPQITVVVKAINSRKVFITGSVAKPGPYPLTSSTTVLQLIAMAGGLAEFADQGKIWVMRQHDGGAVSRFPFNYKEVVRGKNLSQNIELKPGDTVIVP